MSRKAVFILVLYGVLLADYVQSQAGLEPGTYRAEGKGYFYFYHDFSNPAKGSGDGQANAFDFSRMYFGGRYQLSEVFMIRYVSDVFRESKTGKLELATKYAYLDWKLERVKAHLLVGSHSTNNWSAPEKMWGYRVIRKSPMESFGDYWGNVKGIYDDLLAEWADTLDGQGRGDEARRVRDQRENFQTASNARMGSSADLGVGIRFKIKEDYYLNVMIRNGVGYKNAENDNYKNAQVRIGGVFLDGALHLSAYSEVEPWYGKDESGGGKLYVNVQWDFMASYERKGAFLLGANVNGKRFPGSLSNIAATCYSGFGNAFIVIDKLKALARFDYYSTGINDADFASGVPRPKTNAGLIIAGLDYIAHENVHIIPNVQILRYEDKNKGDLKQFYVHAEFKF